MSRLTRWAVEQIKASESQYELAAAIDNGSLELPDWLCHMPLNSQTVRIWDYETGSQYEKFIDIN